MQIPFIEHIGGPGLIKAICWTLVHSLWQGLLLAIIAGIIVMTTKKHRSSLRYNLLSIFFLVFLITACFTFMVELRQPLPVIASPELSSWLNVKKDNNAPANDFKNPFENITSGFTYYFDKYSVFIVTAWFMVFFIRLLKIFSGLSYIHRLRKSNIQSAPDYWQNKIVALKKILQVRKHILLMESSLIKVPMTVGWMKPMILVPLGLITQISPDQVEAILLHELAHIKRRDYFINILQSFAETFFFFNPAVLWISSLMREERENCCDDMAIAVTKSKTKFIHALVSFQEYNVAAEYAMSFPGRKNQLLGRVQRLINNNNKTLNVTEKAFIASCCLAIGLLIFLISAAPVNKMTTNKVQVIEKNNDLSTLAPIASQASADKRDTMLKVMDRPSKKESHQGKSQTAKAASPILNPEMQDLDTSALQDISTILRVTLNNIKLNTSIITNSGPENLDEHKNLSGKQPRYFKPKIKLDPLNDLISKLSIIIAPQQQTPDSSHISRYKNDNSSIGKHPKAKPQSNPLTNPIIVDLIKEKIIDESVIKNLEDFSFVLNNNTLTVQGVQQAAEIYQKLRAKYIKPTGQTTHYYSWKN